MGNNKVLSFYVKRQSYETDRAISNLSLNEFLETYTSDENKIFIDIVKKEDDKWKEKY